MDASVSLTAAAGTAPKETEWRLPGSSGSTAYLCNKQLFDVSGFTEKYDVKRYIHAGWYAAIYEVQDRRDFSRWAIKVTKDGHGGVGSLKCDLDNLKATKGEPSVIQLREHFDFGPVGATVVQLADGDLEYSKQLLASIKDDYAFRTLAKQLLESVDALDRHGIRHSPGVLDFLYFKEEGRVKVSALERGRPCSQGAIENTEALKAVHAALTKAAKNIQLSPQSAALLGQLGTAIPSEDYEKELRGARNCTLIYLQLSDQGNIPEDQLFHKASMISKEKMAELEQKERVRPKPKASDLLNHASLVDIPPSARLELQI